MIVPSHGPGSAPAEARVDRRVQRGQRSRQRILARAMDIASVEGLEALSVRRLAAELEVSKSGVFAQFGSKEELQLATLRAALDVFASRVVKPSRRAPAGIRRVWALCESWFAYARAPTFPGGCFFLSVTTEFDARPGRVRDALAAARRDWHELYRSTVAEAVALGELDAAVDPAELAFELDALARTAAGDALLLDDDAVFERGLRLCRARLLAAAAERAPALA